MYRLLKLPGRIAPACLPRVKIIDMRRHYRQGRHTAISAELKEAIATRLQHGQQIILFLNRRGYSPITICQACGQSFMCPCCAVSLSYHQDSNCYLCHYCDYKQEVTGVCPACGLSALRPLGFGTQKVESEVAALFPEARIGRLDMDSSRKTGHQKGLLHDMQTRQIDILIGTQMVAKGLDYPGVSLVGIVDADVTLNLPDFRAYERTLRWWCGPGQAGRGEPGGIQTATRECSHSAGGSQDMKGFTGRDRIAGCSTRLHSLLRIVVWDGRKREPSKLGGTFSLIYEIIDAKEDHIMVGVTPPHQHLRRNTGSNCWSRLKSRLVGQYRAFPQALEISARVRIEIDIDRCHFIDEDSLLMLEVFNGCIPSVETTR